MPGYVGIWEYITYYFTLFPSIWHIYFLLYVLATMVNYPEKPNFISKLVNMHVLGFVLVVNAPICPCVL